MVLHGAFEVLRRLTKLDVICIIFFMYVPNYIPVSENVSDPRLLNYIWISTNLSISCNTNLHKMGRILDILSFFFFRMAYSSPFSYSMIIFQRNFITISIIFSFFI